MISVQEARDLIARQVPLLPTETVALNQATGRILRESVQATMDSPPFDRSAVDGYAVAGVGSRFKVVGTVATGGAQNLSLEPGTAVRIYTGGRVPAGTKILMQEEVGREDSWIEIAATARPVPVRRQGSEARRGDRVVPAGRRLEAVTLGILAAEGWVNPVVGCRPRVAHLVTGDEIVAPEETPQGSQIRDANSILVRTLVEQAGGWMIASQRLRDEREGLRQAAEKTLAEADLLLISGGASVGDFDFGRSVLEQLSFTVHFHQVRVRPGKPLVFATRGRQVGMVIPGNPVSHVVCFSLFVQPVLRAFLGQPETDQVVYAGLAEDFSFRPNDPETYWPVQLTRDSGVSRVRPLRWESSGHLSALAEADGFMRIPPQAGPFWAGSVVEVKLWLE